MCAFSGLKGNASKERLPPLLCQAEQLNEANGRVEDSVPLWKGLTTIMDESFEEIACLGF